MDALWLATKTIRRLGLHKRELKRGTDGLTYTDNSISGNASLRQVATKMSVGLHCKFYKNIYFSWMNKEQIVSFF